MDWMFVFHPLHPPTPPPTFYVEALTSSVVVFWEEADKEVIKVK